MLGLLSATFFILVLAAPLTAQVRFQRTYGGGFADRGHSVAQTTDTGYVIAGQTGSATTWSDAWLLKTDAYGDTIWTRTYGGTSNDMTYSVAQTTDGGYVITGGTQSFGAGSYDVWLIKTDSTGDAMWTRTYGGANYDGGRSVAQTTDGGYVIAGWTKSAGAGNEDFWLIKTDALGDTIWTRIYGGEYKDYGYAVTEAADGGYVIAGYTRSFGAGGDDGWLIKTNASGNTTWVRTHGGAANDEIRAVAQTADGGYIITGSTESFGAGCKDVWLIKTNATGDATWTRTFGGTNTDVGYSVAQTTDGGYIITGYTFSFGAGHQDVYLIRTDASGDTAWTRTFGRADMDHGYSVTQTTDGGFAVAGWSTSFGGGSEDVYLIKTDSAGKIAIAEPKPPVAFEPAGATIVRGVLNLQSEICNLKSEFVLLNSAGRKVMALQPGENDVRHLAPGVYFMRPASSVERQASSVHKVILTR